MRKVQESERVEAKSVAELRRWLEENYAQNELLWLVTYKKDIPANYVLVHEVLDELLCFGWIDGRRMKLDNERTMQLLSPCKV